MDSDEVDQGPVPAETLAIKANGHLSQTDSTSPENSGKTFATLGTSLLVYCSHFLTAWGDRMWTFAVGIFMIHITPDSLQLTAIYGLTMGTTVLLGGAIIGDWVDNSARLRAAQVSLVLQNVLIILSAAVIYCFLMFKEELLDIGEWTRYVAYALIIVLASAANLATIANTIAVEKDWIVEICNKDEEKLATMTATMRAIDLTTQIIAPIVTGQVMDWSVENGAIFLSAWNLVSCVVEYFLLWKVYNTVPALRKRKDFKRSELVVEPPTVEEKKRLDQTHEVAETNVDESSPMIPNGAGQTSKTKKTKMMCTQSCRLLSGVTIIIEGWKTFAGYDVMLSGLALAFLYMTVLGFDNITVGYAKIQGLSEAIVGICMGGAGLIGILGTFAYPAMRRWVGLPRTGMIALTLQCACLSMCVVSVWLPGSPFDLMDPDKLEKTNCTNMTDVIPLENSSYPVFTVLPPLLTNFTCPEVDTPIVSVSVLMAGIIAARFGLWMADLAITQMFMETVIESERGVVNGVQNSLNQLMDMIKFGVVVALPLAPQFGLLIILSFGFVYSGWILYSIFLCRVPRNLFSRGRKKGAYEKI
ncbi:solute carrier family 40 member 1-like [Physella acuta]|uniref:solute carrier family 40 member 1-like n=1 Tax=Physella acuta TaxID=109671 RepID=UPI0027DCC69C|nr:solute carrier family 40 member 1-like [Physella acuta]XP_059177688.1 solute carrier family 40 member 1-like [Physella acuta]XP_059177689.1 solute carrier family 40 member 1-like [Physella acuta]XP_059177690.1 solute carrier family 40 member 1-like [Physella acuta]XP_059177691.1 solute carrier family 40 member 1-like [Physella acuta]XP_059177692.1 solute carrier family 40 member 1-like [Physella acuta]